MKTTETVNNQENKENMETKEVSDFKESDFNKKTKKPNPYVAMATSGGKNKNYFVKSCY